MANVLVDMDGVLADLIGGIHEIDGIPKLEVTGWDFAPYTGRDLDMIWEAMYSEGFFRNLPLINNAKRGLMALRSAGHNVFICTTPLSTPHCAGEKIMWVKSVIGKGWKDRIILTKDKTMIVGDYLIDDKPIITGAITPQWEHIIFDQPYNRNVHGMRVTWDNLSWIEELK